MLVLPILATLCVYPFMASLIARGRRPAATLAALLWAASLSAAIIAATRRDPAMMGGIVLHGPAYRDEMFAFVRSGAGRESDPFQFVPQHLLHLLVFASLSIVSGGALGILLGAVLVGYMSYYVGSLAAAGGAPATALLYGWPPYAILRVVAFVILGVCLSEPLLLRLRRRSTGSPSPAARRPYYLAAALLLLADLIIKWLCAPAWAALLRPCLGS